MEHKIEQTTVHTVVTKTEKRERHNNLDTAEVQNLKMLEQHKNPDRECKGERLFGGNGRKPLQSHHRENLIAHSDVKNREKEVSSTCKAPKSLMSHTDSDYSLNGSKGMAATKNKIPGIDQKPVNGRNLKGMKALQSNLKVEKDKADFVRKSRMNKEKQKKNSSHEQADSKKGKPQLSKSKPKR